MVLWLLDKSLLLHNVSVMFLVKFHGFVWETSWCSDEGVLDYWMLHFDFLSGLKWVLKITVRHIDEKLQCWTENKADFKMKNISSCHVSKVILSSNEYIMKYSFWGKDECIMECKTIFQE